MKANLPTLPPTPAKTGPGRKRSPGPVPAWGLKLGGLLSTVMVFAGSFGYTSTHLYVANAPLRPATVAVAAVTPTTGSGTATTTTTLTPRVRTTDRRALTTTASS